MFENEFIQNALISMGFPEDVFKTGIDGQTVLWTFLLSTEMILLVLSIVIWCGTLFARLYSSGTLGNHENHVRRNEAVVHSYDAKNMKLKYKEERSPNIISVVIRGFIMPVLVIYAAILISYKMVGFDG